MNEDRARHYKACPSNKLHRAVREWRRIMVGEKNEISGSDVRSPVEWYRIQCRKYRICKSLCITETRVSRKERIPACKKSKKVIRGASARFDIRMLPLFHPWRARIHFWIILCRRCRVGYRRSPFGRVRPVRLIRWGQDALAAC